MPDKTPEITITGNGAEPTAEPITATSAEAAVGADATEPNDSAAPIAEGAEGKPAEVATQIAPGTVDRVQQLVPGATIDGEPHPDAPVKWGIFSHLLEGLSGVLHGHLGVIAGAASTALERPSVQRVVTDIEQLAAKETELAYELLRKAQAVLMGELDVIIHDTEAAAQDLAFAAIPTALRAAATAAVARVMGGSHAGEPAPEGILVALQHGINALGARLTHLGRA